MKRSRLLLTVIVALLLGISAAQAQYYGESLGETEQLAVANTFQYALENNQSGAVATWNNPDSTHSGSTVPLRTFQTTEGLHCREYQQFILIGGNEEQGFGTACRQLDGSWRIVDPDSLSDVSRDAGKEISRTYRYYDPWAFAYPYPYTYFPHHIAFSFGFFHHDGHFFSGHRHFNGNRHFRGSRTHFRGNARHLRGGSKGHFRSGGKGHFRSGNKGHLRGSKVNSRGGGGHSRGGNKGNFRGGGGHRGRR